MLAELASGIDGWLPQELLDTAHVLSGELAWSALDALRIVDWLKVHGNAVVGVELCRDENGAFSWLATSNYSPRLGDVITPTEVARCAEEAVRFIARFEAGPDNLFNLAWQPTVPDETPASLAA